MTQAPVFVLAPPLGLGAHLAACLGRHPQLTDLPAVQLMCADSPQALAASWGPKLQGHDHGLIRAAAALKFGGDTQAGVAEAAAWLAEHQSHTSRELFADLAEAAAPGSLVDASFLYCVEDSALPRIIAACPDARFIHLVRHPALCFETPETAAKRSEGLWLRPHLRAHAFLKQQAPLNWLILRAEWLAADPQPRLASLFDWLGIEAGQDVLDRVTDPNTPTPFAKRGPEAAAFGVDPALVADPGLDALFNAPVAPELDEEAWAARGFDPELRAMARVFGYV